MLFRSYRNTCYRLSSNLYRPAGYIAQLSPARPSCFGFQSIEQLSPWSWKGPIFSASVEDSATIHAFGDNTRDEVMAEP